MDQALSELEALMGAPAVDHGARAHAKLSASGTSRWWNCLGSALLTADIPSRSSKYAEEGTAAHEVGNMCLEQGMDAVEFVDRIVHKHTVDTHMAEAVQVYLDKCREYRPEDGWEVHVERKFSLERLKPPAPMFGTADFVAINRKMRRMVIIDYKHGQGVTVAAEDNPQLLYYALGAICAFGDTALIDDIDMFIVQPRGRGQAIKSATISAIALIEWSLELIERAKMALTPGAPLLAGSWCKFCPASGACPEQANAALRVAQLEFDEPMAPYVSDAEMDDLMNISEGKASAVAVFNRPSVPVTVHSDPVEKAGSALPEIRLLTEAQIGQILSKLDTLEEWVNGVRKRARDILETGGAVPGWTLAPTRPQRSFAGEEDTIAAILTKSFSLPEDKVWKRKLTTPAQAEAALAETHAVGRTKKAAKEMAAELLKPYVEAKSSGTNLTPISDAHPALSAGRGTEFEALPAETQ